MALTAQQQTTLANAIKASTDPVVTAALLIRDDVTLTNWCNAASTFVAWKTFVALGEVGKTFIATAIAAITAGNNDKLTSYALWNPTGVNPSRADTRAFFDDIFSVAAGATTRTALLALWKRFATNAERAFATGTGTDATPGNVVWEGMLTITEVSTALNLNP
jgi:hypothetical protein